jgi:hypothetical protein
MHVIANQVLAHEQDDWLYISQFCNCPIDALIFGLEHFAKVLGLFPLSNAVDYGGRASNLVEIFSISFATRYFS